MTAARMLRAFGWASMAVPVAAFAQIPDMLTAFDAGGRAMGAGSSFYATGVDSLSATYNPAGLGYARSRGFLMTSRNFPKSTSAVTGSLADLRLNTTSTGGEQGLGHVGLVYPLESKAGADRGSFSIAWTVGGWFNDLENGNNLTGGIATYTDFTRAKTSFVTLSYGKAKGDSGFSWGLGLAYAMQNVRNFQRITFTDNNIPPQINDSDDTGTGMAAIAGLLYTPKNQPNLSIGASVRTPVSVRSNAAALGLYDHIPGRFVLGASMANDGLRGGRDSMVFGAQLQVFFDGDHSDRLDRKSTYSSFGAGLEYAYSRGAGVIPIRVGFNFVPAGGEFFRQRSGLTYGIGYRPNDGDWTIDINFAKPSGGGHDTSFLFGYRYGG